MSIQALFDAISEQWKQGRAETQMTLGDMISVLEAMPGTTAISGLGNPHSYRGYYSDLAFEPQGETVTAVDLLAACTAVLGETLEGYKGGDFLMDDSTPVWAAYYGSCGQKLITITPDGQLETAEDD